VAAPAGRAGLLTHGALLSILARDNDTDPVKRGKFIRDQLLCAPPPPPPGNLDIVPPPPDGKRTQRERLLPHSSQPACASCHVLMDPLGLAFESFDGIGKYRTKDVGKDIDTSGTLTAARPEGAPFANAVELVRLLADSPDAHTCFVKQTFEYAQGRTLGASDGCSVNALDQRFGASKGNIIELMVAMAADDSLHLRTVLPVPAP